VLLMQLIFLSQLARPAFQNQISMLA
jgi:hypothetical protein